MALRWVVGVAVLAVAALLPASVRTTPRATPTARVGAFYFDGWAGDLSNFHFDGLAHPGPLGYFPERRPLSGWRDNTPAAVEAQLRWAHADGISFFLFDWFRADIDPSIDGAYHNYLKLREHDGVGFALAYIGNGPFGIGLDALPAVADRWVTEDFQNPDYVRIDGKPLLVVYEFSDAATLWGGAAGVNKGIEIIQQAAKKRRLPGVFVVATHYEPVEYTQNCFLNCGYDGDLLSQRWDALSKYSFNADVKPVDGPIPYSSLAAAEEAIWSRYAQQGTFRFIPSIPAGWDERSSNELVKDSSATPRLFWYTRTPNEIGGLLRDAIQWVNDNPQMRVEPAPAPPLVLVEAWNELQEGAYIVPTDDVGYRYGQAIARAVGINWTPPPKHTLRVALPSHGTVASTPAGISCPPTCAAAFDEGIQVTLTARAERASVLDRWSGCTDTDPTCSIVLLRDSTVRPVFLPTLQRRTLTLRLSGHLVASGSLSARDGYSGCASNEPVQIQRRQGRGWPTVTSTLSDQAGRYTAQLRDQAGTYRARAPREFLGSHGPTCLTATSQTVIH